MAVNFSKYQDEITKAWKTVVDTNNEPKWALFGYEGSTNVIKLMTTGSKGLDEMVDELNCSLIQYAFCRVIDQNIGLNQLVLINWQGESAPLSRKGLCASHVGDVTNYFKGCAQTITIRNDDEATREHIMEQISRTNTSKINLTRHHQSTTEALPREHNLESASLLSNNDSSLLQKNKVSANIAEDRKSFWQRQEEEEKERLAEEKRRAAEKQAEFERERKQREEYEARKLAETVEQRDRLIEATKQADRQANISPLASSGGSSQPSSILSSGPTAGDEDDGRVGRRSELIRLERNQETQSLISKGLIKNKRAIFEQQAEQAKQQQLLQPTLSRRGSGAMVTQRLNAFKSLDVSNSQVTSETVPPTNLSTAVNKLANGFTEKLSVNSDEECKNAASNAEVKKIVEAVKLINDENQSSTNVSFNNGMTADRSHDEQSGIIEDASSPKSKYLETSEEIGNKSIEPEKPVEISRSDQEAFGINKQSSPAKEHNISIESGETHNHDNFLSNGNFSEAIALYDYQSADNTEISFDPDDKIGYIQKVDVGWWQGTVLSGRYKGQIGLFPSNYVKEI